MQDLLAILERKVKLSSNFPSRVRADSEPHLDDQIEDSHWGFATCLLHARTLTTALFPKSQRLTPPSSQGGAFVENGVLVVSLTDHGDVGMIRAEGSLAWGCIPPPGPDAALGNRSGQRAC